MENPQLALIAIKHRGSTELIYRLVEYPSTSTMEHIEKLERELRNYFPEYESFETVPTIKIS